MLELLTGGARAFSKMISWVAIGANAVGTLIVLGLVLIVNYDVVARGLFNAPSGAPMKWSSSPWC
ncbi:hypothetical protein [Labrenzia sp. VG12]|uniref:hypothetical protein n=1 Tax=Labrenzia sp. VG12 TaxID=2021862 RepID=UPI001AD8D0C2|nr:hypothetical protein [Labrenzia sp. VG12]